MGKLKKRHSRNIKKEKRIVSNYNNQILSVFEYWFKSMKKVENYTSKPLYFTIVMIGFLVYTIAYVFFYSYYFSGNAIQPQSVLQLIINPIPFNFKSLVALGFLFISIVIILVFITNRISESLKCKSKYILADIFILVLVLTCIHVFITLVFIGEFDFQEKYLTMWVFVSTLCIYFATSQIGKLKYMLNGVFGSFIIMIIISIINLWVNYSFSAHQYFSIAVIIMLVITLLSAYLNFTNIIFYTNAFIILYFILAEWFRIKNIYSFNSILLVFLVIALVKGLSWLSNKLYYMIFKNTNSKLQTRFRSTSTSKGKSKLGYRVGVVIDKYRILLIYLVLLVITASGYYSLYSFGQTMGRSMNQNRYDEITFSGGLEGKDKDVIIGNIVCYKNDVYYISNENRELITIKVENIKSKPYKK